MKDERWIYNQEQAERKRLKNNARYKKNGSKSKYCRLPSDGMTATEWKRRNGEVQTISKDMKLSWDEFKKYPIHMQKEYISMMRENYGARNKDLAEMFGIEQTSLSHYFQRNIPEAKNGRGTKKIDARWMAFMEENTEAKEEPETKDKNNAPEPEEAHEAISAEEMIANMDSAFLRFTGTPELVFVKVLTILDRRKKYNFSIQIEDGERKEETETEKTEIAE